MPNFAEMNGFQMLEMAAWILSAIIGLWLFIDMVRTNSKYSDDVLLSSREGEIEDELIIDPTHRG